MTGDIKWGAATGHPIREKKVNEGFCRQIGADSVSQALVFMRDFSCPLGGYNDSRGFLECIHEKFNLQVIEEPRRGIYKATGGRLSANACIDRIRENSFKQTMSRFRLYILGRNFLLYG